MTLQAPIHDIVVAPAAHWWPLAPGWYLLGLVAVTVGLIAMIGWARRYLRLRPRRLAIQQLQQQAPTRVTEITLLLKQVALAYHSHAAMGVWWEFLAKQLPPSLRQTYQPLLQNLATISYQPQSQQQTWVEPYREFALVWLQQALPPRHPNMTEPGHD